MTKPKIEYCDECRWDNGNHYADDEARTISRPHHDAAKAAEVSLQAVGLAHEQQTEQAHAIIEAAAETMLEFSANQIRQQMVDAGIDGPIIGAAFAWAAAEGLIEDTGRTVPSTEASTRHRIHVWRSVEKSRPYRVGVDV